MVAYLLIAIFPLLLNLCFNKVDVSKREKRLFCFLCFLALFLFLGLRSEFVGNNDTNNYCEVYEYAIHTTSLGQFLNDKKGMEPGFLVFLFLLSRFLRFRQAIILFTSFIFAGSVSLFIYKNSKIVSLSYVIFITLGLMIFEATAMRQGIAICLCLLAYEFSKKRKFALFVLTVLLAFTFHKTSIVFLITYPLGFLRKNWFITFSLIFLGILSLYFGRQIMAHANDFFGKEYNNKIDSGGYVMVLTYFALAILSPLFSEAGPNIPFRKVKKTLFDNGRIVYLSIITLFCYLMRYFGGQAAERICYYFMFLELIVFPNAISKIKDNNFKLFIECCFSIFMIALFCYRLSGSDLLPYSFLGGN